MIDHAVRLIGILLMGFGATSLVTNLHGFNEIWIFTIGLLLIINANFFTLKRRIQILEAKLANEKVPQIDSAP
ncbi:MAG: hypothetical protein EOO53_00295 [Gammaproteobacteria bacterium]|nr:MAG: hypothetical protein EOO53_00295 [Gammaproteobacteria bacterium]